MYRSSMSSNTYRYTNYKLLKTVRFWRSL